MTDDIRPRGPLKLAGDRMVMTEDLENGALSFAFNDVGTGRGCGSCTLCCKLVPVKDIAKEGGERCRYLKAGSKAGGGCRIYEHRPESCRIWFCRWVSDPNTAGMPRPDRCHYVIDTMRDTIKVRHDDGDCFQEASVLQVWVDPAFPDAWRSPECMAYIEDKADKLRMPTLIRLPPTGTILVFAPSISEDQRWHELRNAPTDPTRHEPGMGEVVRVVFEPEPGEEGGPLVIENGKVIDTSDIPEGTEADFARARLVMPGDRKV